MGNKILLLDELKDEALKGRTVLTGDRPTGPLHLGHFLGSLCSRVFLQEKMKQYIMVADVQALTDNASDPGRVVNGVFEVVKDYLAVGINPDLTTIFIQSQIPEIAELTIYFLNLVTVSRLERNPTVKTEIARKGYDTSVPAGFLCYPVSQAADILIFNADFVPVGEDQLPMIEQTNEIVHKFNSTYGSVFKEVKTVLSRNSRLVGIDGKSKAGKSLGNAIFLKDSPEIIRQKVFQMYTDPNHIKTSDPGKIEGNVVFEYLSAFHSDKEELTNLKAQYTKGGLGDTTIKEILNESLQKFLEPIRARRESFELELVQNVLAEGNEEARKIAKETLAEVKDVMGISYKELM